MSDYKLEIKSLAILRPFTHGKSFERHSTTFMSMSVAKFFYTEHRLDYLSSQPSGHLI